MLPRSVHLQRKAGTVDTAFTHQIYDLLADTDHTTFNEEDDNEKPEMKNRNFEFSNSYHVYRFLKLIFFIQTIEIIISDPSFHLSLFFDIFCKGILFYSHYFYSRPFLDILYLIQYFWMEIINSIQSQHLPTTPKNVEISSSGRRQLNTNP